MNWLQPAWLFGALGIALPVLIHFWHQKKARPLPWAASRWLTENATLQHRGFRLHDLLLLLVRCLLIILLSIMLARPLLQWWKKDQGGQVIHLVEPDAALISDFRFELENALKRGEKVIWITKDAGSVKNLALPPTTPNAAMHLQQAINTNVTAKDSLRLYLTNNAAILDMPEVVSEAPLQLFIFDKKQKDTPAELTRLLAGRQLKPQILLSYKNSAELKTANAAWNAIEEIYGLKISMDTASTSGKRYDFVHTNALPEPLRPETDYIISGSVPEARAPGNVHFLSDSLRFATSELVKTGGLPEWLGEIIVGHYRLDPRQGAVSLQQFKSRFEQIPASRGEEAAVFQKWLLLPFLCLLMLERWLALRKNAATYA